MNAQIIYFSGTGNTEFIAKRYEEALKNIGYEVSCSSIEKPNPIGDHNLLLIGGPIYAGNMPDELINWVRIHIPQTQQPKTAIVFSTSAGLANAYGVKSIGKKLQKKGYTLIDLATFEMPRNFYIDKYDPTPEALRAKQLKDAAQGIITSISKLDYQNPLQLNDSVIMIDLMADLFRQMARFLGKNFSITDSCTGCGKCERDCPKGNIDYALRNYHTKCILCTRCIHNCPVNAITYKKKQIEQYRI